MKNSFTRSMFLYPAVVVIMSAAISLAGAEGLLKRNSGQPSGLKQQELDDAYYRGYNDAISNRQPVNYTAGGPENKGDVIRGAGRGALGGAAIGKLSDGDTGKGAAWGAGAGAVKGAVKRRRAAEEENTWAAELSNAYNSGYNKGVSEKSGAHE